ncbi:MAG: 2-oxoacid:acceptor oxidoreductase subunit alpha [Candidatus Thorarchaeota archaeon]|nr:2-oxoacid:acceptor oxidoreductase subunit alpha [Candidatus Thorarchaeota archaeon]
MSEEKKRTYFWQGNQACAEAAISAGCRFFAGYPITPASEIAEIMAKRLPEVGGTYLQMEDEIGAISAIVGASWGGMLSMTATSGPGFSLMQENIGYAIMTETPCVIIDVQRAGPSTGQATKVAQGDFMQARWGTHGDHESIVLAPNSAQECYELTLRAFQISESIRHPVILLSDEVVAHSREGVVVKPNDDVQVHRRFARKNEPHFGGIDAKKQAIMPRFGDGHDLLVTGSTHDKEGFRKTSDPEAHNALVRRLALKIQNNRSLLTDFVVSGPETGDWGIISYGCTSRSVEELIATNSSKLAIRSFRPRGIWPFPDVEMREFAQSVDRLLVPELSLGQLSREVSRSVGSDKEIVSLTKIGGGLLIEPDELLRKISEELS